MKKEVHYEANKKHINQYKMAHMIAVAEYMRENAHKYNLDKDLMYVLGLLHDIGYLKGRKGHEEYGYEMMVNIFGDTDYIYSKKYKGSFWEAIRDHGTDPYKVIEKESTSEHTLNIKEDKPDLFLLYEADMCIDAKGFYVGFKGRLKDIKERYGEDSIAYKTASNTVKYVTQNMYDYIGRYGDKISIRDWFTDGESIYMCKNIYCDIMYYSKVYFNDDDEWELSKVTEKIKLEEFNNGQFDIAFS